MTRRAFTPEQDLQLAADYTAGATYRELAAQHGTSDIVIRSAVLRGGGVPRRNVRRSSWTDQSRPEALRMYRDGASVKDVSKHFAVRTAVISEMLAEAGEELHPGGKPHPSLRTEDQCRDAAARYGAGASLSALAEHYRCSVPAVAGAIERGGGAIRPSGQTKIWSDEVIAWAVSQYEGGRSEQSIADELGISQGAVSNRLIAEGVITRGPAPRGDKHHSWKGGRTVNDDGYVKVRPTAADLTVCTPDSNGYVLEHRLVMARALGRPLLPHPTETVHHKDGDHGHNDLSNLQLRRGNHGIGVVLQCRSCGSHDVEAVEIAD